MSGHNKWSTIKHKKAAEDAKRGKLFSRLIREIMVAARDGGDIEANPRLRTAVRNAQNANMPKENMERAIRRGTGELPGVVFEEAVYEGYGPGGAAVFIEITTDNRNRTTAEIRHIFSRYSGNMGESGCVSWLFDRRGLLILDAGEVDEEEVINVALEAGADDVNQEDETIEVLTAPEDLETVKEAIQQAGMTPTLAEVSMIPQTTIKLDDSQARTMLKLMDALEDCDDVQHVWANFDVPNEIMQEMST